MRKIWWGVGTAAAVALAALILQPVFAGKIILPQAFFVGPLEIRFYGVGMALAVLAGYWVARANAWRFGLAVDEITRVVFWAVIVGLAGARLYYVLLDWGSFAADPLSVFKIWQGGLSLYGGLAAGLLFVTIWTRNKLYTAAQLLDTAALALPVAQAVGRLGNLFNYEAYGHATELPWKMFVPAEFRVDVQADYFHPVFLYEAAANLIIFGMLMALRGKLRPGGLAILYLGAYGLVRFCLEPLRVDSTMLAGFRLDQMVSAAAVLIAIVLALRLRFMSPKTSR